MRFLFLLLTVPLCVAAPAFAQVTVNLNALNALPTTGAPANRVTPEARHYRARPRSAQRRVARVLPIPPIPPGTAGAATVAAAAPGTTPAGSSGVGPRPAPLLPPPAAVVPPAAPPQVALAPLPPPGPAAAPPPPPVVAQAPSHATANATGLTVSFGPDSADLSPASAAAVASLAHSVPQSDSISFNVPGLCARPGG